MTMQIRLVISMHFFQFSSVARWIECSRYESLQKSREFSISKRGLDGKRKGAATSLIIIIVLSPNRN